MARVAGSGGLDIVVKGTLEGGLGFGSVDDVAGRVGYLAVLGGVDVAFSPKAALVGFLLFNCRGETESLHPRTVPQRCNSPMMRDPVTGAT